ncbi:MAG: cell division protein FtsZ [Myxococcales bacterium]|nr:cell division protein FtsZ [Myxococcales bacterium]
MFGGGNDAHLSLLRPRIVVFGIGGAGGNAVNNMIRAKLKGVEFVAANTDAQSLRQSLARYRLQLGRDITEGLGAGSRPEIGRQAAEEGIDDILDYLDGAHMAFITAGMGGGTGTGAAPVIAKIAREEGILTVGVVTQPFKFEGPHRMRIAEGGIKQLRKWVDTLIVIPNQKLFKVADEDTTVVEAFAMADDVLLAGVSGLTDLMLWPGLVNLDFADIRTVISAMGEAMMGTGESTGEHRATEAARKAIGNPLLSDGSLSPERCLRALAMMRLVNPRAEIRVAGGREGHLRSMEVLALWPANSLFVEGYLTTKGDAVRDTYQMIREAGFEIEGNPLMDADGREAAKAEGFALPSRLTGRDGELLKPEVIRVG